MMTLSFGADNCDESFQVQRVFYWVSLLQQKRICFPCAFALWHFILKLFLLFLVEKEAYEEVEAKEEEDEGKVSET